MARCLYAGSIKKAVPCAIFRPPVGGRWSVYDIAGLGLLGACAPLLDHALPPGATRCQA